MKVLVLTKYTRLGASSRVRILQYLPLLSKSGIEFTVCPLFCDEYLTNLYSNNKRFITTIIGNYLERIRAFIKFINYDLIWIEKEILPGIPGLLEKLLTYLQVPYILDFDDATFHSYDINSNYFLRVFLGKKIGKIMRLSSMVIACNNYLAERAKEAGARRIEIIPSVVDLERYQVENTSNNTFIIGWVGTPRTVKYLGLIQHALTEVCRNSNVKLMTVGSGPIKLKHVPGEVRIWSEDTEVASIKRFDVGIMPLIDEPFDQGKCGYKLIQYMAGAKPVVATPVGMNCEIVQHGVNGYLAETESDWVYFLRRLINQPEERIRMGRSGRAMVEEKYCLQVTAPRLLKLLEEVAHNR